MSTAYQLPGQLARLARLGMFVIPDPGNGTTFYFANSNPVFWPITTGAAAETRTLAAPTGSGQILAVWLNVDGGGDCNFTITGGCDTAGTTTLVFNVVGQYMLLCSGGHGSNFRWRILAAEGVYGPASDLAWTRSQLRWRPLENGGKPCIAADIAYQYDMAMGLAGTNMTTALCTVPTTGGILLTTAAAANDQAILQPHATAAYSAWRDINFTPGSQPTWETKIKTGASVTAYLLKAGLCLTNANDVGTDADQVAFFYNDDSATLPLLLQVITSIANTDVAVSTGITLALSTIYRLKITVDASLIARCYVNGELVATTTALTTAAALKPFISIDNEGVAGAKALTVYGQDASLIVA